jgi:hypothetical protein
VRQVLHAPGRPLDGAARNMMEARFGHDFGNVRVHADERAAESSRAVKAKAYTVGNDIVFNRGEYQPRSTAGLGSLAHELAHVVQQTADGAGAIPEDVRIGGPGDAAEREAEQAGRGGWPGTAVSLREEPCLRRQGDEQTKKEPPPVIPIPIFDRLDIKPVIPGLPLSPPSLEDINKGLFFFRGGQSQGGAGNVGCAPGWKMRKDGMCCEGTSVDKCCPPYRLTILGRCCPSDQYAKGAECVKFNLPMPTLPAAPAKTPAPAPVKSS